MRSCCLALVRHRGADRLWRSLCFHFAQACGEGGTRQFPASVNGMQVHQLVETAALVAGQAPVLLKVDARISESALEQYWISAKCRLDRWGRALKEYSTRMKEPAAPRSLLWNAAQPMLEEILASEALTRVWTALGCALDRQHNTSDITPIVRSIYLGHLEARNRVLSLMLQGQGFGVEAAVLLNRLRHRSERWTDMLLGYIQTAGDVREFAFDSERMLEFADDIQHEAISPGGALAWQMVLASLRGAFQRSLICESVNNDLNERIVSAVLSCFDTDAFDSSGVLKSLWLVRMSHVAKDTQGLIDVLIAEDHPPPHRIVSVPKRRF